MCNFNQAWVGQCKNEDVQGSDYCEEHLKEKCSVCGEQATHDCDETNMLVCGAPLCDSIECKLQHFYKAHGYAFHEVKSLETKLEKKPFKIVIAEINHGSSDFGQKLNEMHEGRLEVILMTYKGDDEVKFYGAGYRYYIKKKDEIVDLFKNTFYYDIASKVGVYYSKKAIDVTKTYQENILDSFEKISI